MKIHFHIVVALLCLLVIGCKKVPERGNSEKDFTLYFAEILTIVDTVEGKKTQMWVYKDTCYQKVYGVGRPALSSCSNSSNGFKLPLNIDAYSSKFYFQQGNKKDSITIYYRTKYETGGHALEVVYLIDSIYMSFPRWTATCIKDITPYCKDNEAFMSATVY